MKVQNIVLLVILTAIIAIIFFSLQGSQDDSAYIAEINKEREKNNRFMLSAESPLENKETFKQLNYYPPDIRYRIVADLIPIESKKVVVLHTNDGKEQRYIEYAHAEFQLDGMKHKLLILEGIDMGPIRGKLFLAFGDETSAIETYGAGRYLDLNKVPGSTTIVLDFNRAYNPYCAYNPTYSCPLPPRENLLKVPIKAGEKLYH